MASTHTDITRPSDIDRELKLPPAVRYFEAEPVRTTATLAEYRDEAGRLHNDHGYAVYLDDGTEEWWRHGHAHSVDDWPAISLGNSSELDVFVPSGLQGGTICDRLDFGSGALVWCEDGLIHRIGDPAVQLCPGIFNYCEYWHMGRRHRADGPALIDCFEKWYYHGLLHRCDGPAVVNTSRNHTGVWVWYGEVFCDGAELGEEDFPFHEPPPAFYMTALLSMMTTPVLHAKSIDVIVARIALLMPDFPALWFGREGCEWHEIRRAIAICLEEHTTGVGPKAKRKRKAKIDVISLPEFFLDED